MSMWKRLGGKGTINSGVLLFTPCQAKPPSTSWFLSEAVSVLLQPSQSVAAETWADSDKVSDLSLLPSQRTRELCRPTKFTSPQCFMHCGRERQHPGGCSGSVAQGKPWKASWRAQAQASSCGGPTLGSGLNC